VSEQRQPTVVVSGFGVTPQYVYQQPVKVRYLLVEALFAPVDRVFVGFSMAAPNASDFPFAYSRYDGEVLVGKSGHFDLGSVQTVRPRCHGSCRPELSDG
jgi:hypothetical protein